MGNHNAATLPVPISTSSPDDIGERYHAKLESFITFETTDGDAPLRRFAQLPLPVAIALVAALAERADIMDQLKLSPVDVDSALVVATGMHQGSDDEG